MTIREHGNRLDGNQRRMIGQTLEHAPMGAWFRPRRSQRRYMILPDFGAHGVYCLSTKLANGTEAPTVRFGVSG